MELREKQLMKLTNASSKRSHKRERLASLSHLKTDSDKDHEGSIISLDGVELIGITLSFSSTIHSHVLRMSCQSFVEAREKSYFRVRERQFQSSSCQNFFRAFNLRVPLCSPRLRRDHNAARSFFHLYPFASLTLEQTLFSPTS